VILTEISDRISKNVILCFETNVNFFNQGRVSAQQVRVPQQRDRRGRGGLWSRDQI
jgi:hypothetical protein